MNARIKELSVLLRSLVETQRAELAASTPGELRELIHQCDHAIMDDAASVRIGAVIVRSAAVLTLETKMRESIKVSAV